MFRPTLRTALALGAGAALALAAAACSPASSKPAATGTSTGSGAPDCSPATLHLVAKGTLTIATDTPAYAPWFDNNTPSDGKGFESAVAYAVAAKLGFTQSQVKWVTEPFDNSYAPGPKNFDFDLNQISITDERKKAVDFSSGYYTVTQGVITLKTSKYAGATSLAGLKPAKIGVQVGTTSMQAVQGKIAPSQQPAVFTTTDDEVNALKNGQIDALVTDLPTVFYLTASSIDNGKVVGQFDYTDSGVEQFGALFAKGNPLVGCVDGAIDQLKSGGELAALTTQWLSTSANAPKLG
ncbi:extracellular solute-binding protein family 3 [Catenulispora acidiphila DSM 44928]|uniref:Extracellular solute-binding protein family 3 n=1 Tax=Catenulispora acidiphila (strain DSM 44928 / JCM 14897 / NBRC 102108 / NRRL B-24433 / ID139908) TaxID=479433 RepID=C7Q113_CATAD|nr:ABC transporter substrate-binding protein [Catenulispora acidiphila]ACU71688.1 extracellular solute-binding protein family 3 [Catenulispora acidiphila DSM 44928]